MKRSGRAFLIVLLPVLVAPLHARSQPARKVSGIGYVGRFSVDGGLRQGHRADDGE